MNAQTEPPDDGDSMQSRSDAAAADDLSPGTPESTARSGPEAGEDDARTATHQAQPGHTVDATVISKQAPDGRVAPPPAERLTNVDIGKQLEGTKLDEYLLEQFVGGGGMGAVFRATDSVLQRTVAIKVLTTRYGENDEEARRFEQEAQSAARLNHENIAHVYGYGKASGWHYIVLEFIEGQNLRDVVQQAGGLSVDDTISLAWQITEALSHASAQGIVHRDIKPSNVIVTPNRQAKLVDMGLAKVHQLDSGERDLTATGMTLGTFDYISPEQGEDPSQADVRSDLYSLGCTIYFMLTAQPPFPVGTPIQKILKHKNEMPADVRHFRDDVPAGLLAILRCLLAKEPRDRFQTPRELTDALIQFADSQEVPPHSRAIERRAERRRHGFFYRNLEWLVPLALLVTTVFLLERYLQSQAASSAALPEFRLPAATTTTATTPTVVAPLKMPPVARRPKREAMSHPPEPALPSPPIEEPPSRPGTLLEEKAIRVVDDSMAVDGELTFHDANEAFQAALADPLIQRIEFHATARYAVAPLQLANRRLELVASEGAWPVITFADSYPNGSAVQMNGGSLQVDGVHFEFNVESPTSLFRLVNVETLQWNRVWLTVNASSALTELAEPSAGTEFEPARIFEVTTSRQPTIAPADGDELPVAVDERIDEPTAISLERCIVRGHATLLAAQADQACRLSWNNGLLCIRGALARLSASTTMSAEIGQHQIDVDHLTAVMEGGMIVSVASPTHPKLATVDCNVTRSILATTSDQPLIQFRGAGATEGDLGTTFFYAGQRNFYRADCQLLAHRRRGAAGFRRLAGSLVGVGEFGSVQ